MKPAKAGWEMAEPALAGLRFIRHGFQSMGGGSNHLGSQ